MSPVLSAGQRAFLWALALALVPPSRDLSEERRKRYFAIVEDMLASRPAGMRRLLSVFLVVMRWLPLVRFGGRLDRLAPDRQRAALQWFEEFPVALVRTGFWGVKTLVMMGYYAQPEIARENGWTPSRSGNEKLHA